MFDQNRTHDQVTTCCIFATLGHRSCNFQIRPMHQKCVTPQNFIAITNAYINKNSQHKAVKLHSHKTLITAKV